MAPVDPNLYRSASKASYLDVADEVLSPQFEKLYRAAKRRAKKADIPFKLTRRELSALAEYAGGKCSYTNILFSEESDASLRYRPYAPSIDRYDSGGIYSFKNCFLVCAMVNMAKGAKSISLMHLMMLDYAAAHGALLPEKLFNSDPADHWKY